MVDKRNIFNSLQSVVVSEIVTAHNTGSFHYFFVKLFSDHLQTGKTKENIIKCSTGKNRKKICTRLKKTFPNQDKEMTLELKHS